MVVWCSGLWFGWYLELYFHRRQWFLDVRERLSNLLKKHCATSSSYGVGYHGVLQSSVAKSRKHVSAPILLTSDVAHTAQLLRSPHAVHAAMAHRVLQTVAPIEVGYGSSWSWLEWVYTKLWECRQHGHR